MASVVRPPIKRRGLAILLQGLQALTEPRVELEQYQTPAEVAAEVLFNAYGSKDVQGRVVADLGCGNGIFAIGAKRLGAERVVALDVDTKAIEVARENASHLGLEVDFLTMDVGEFEEEVDTVFTNPPFGGQRRHADVPFLEVALRCSRVTYTFHNAETRGFVKRRIADLGGIVDYSTTYKFPLSHTHPFHRKEVEELDVDLYRIVKEVG
ncbi:MAG: METTL5 family protein [Thermoplasmata archaeon]